MDYSPSLPQFLNTSLLSLISADELAVIIPVRNEALHLPELLESLGERAENIILIDDGSNDQSAILAHENGARVIRHPERLGKTSCVRSALPAALESDWILFMDGDGQHDPSDLQKFWNARQGMDAVLGWRDLASDQMPLRRRIVNRLMSWILHRTAGGDFPDTQCGYRLVRSAWLADWLPAGKEYEWETELYFRLMRTGARVRSIPIRTIYRQERSKIFWPRETWRFLRTCLMRKNQAANHS